jgi:hypothetical protein
MRKNVVGFLLVTLVVLAFAIHNVWVLITLLFVDGAEDQISRAELPAPMSGAISQQPQLIPKIIHQTYINESLPAHWIEPQQSCLDLHPDYEYKVRAATRQGLTEQPLTANAALDGQEGTRVYSSRIPVVFGDVRRVPLPDPARRRHQILCAPPFWRHLH